MPLCFLPTRTDWLKTGSNKDKGYVSDLARQSTLRGHGMSNFSIRIAIVMSLLDSPVEIRENSIQFSMETEFCEFSPELEDHFGPFHSHKIFEPRSLGWENSRDSALGSINLATLIPGGVSVYRTDPERKEEHILNPREESKDPIA
ncbi:hypothetical protein GOBAR_AA40019 [Gossypium barbadense]|uniref:Uncharacterized protein n=1 Tax=Gossypium barbadense TaxID=3634 RepID=A0A2P5VPE5_GOSBA|nr:hypothetical protein GOBAR_AA40019 [Gossypium barbadense]